ncbi:histidine phosphatase family protein [Garicola koreensis]|uniref:Putative phosphoglycerate mutase n=1 Tax=Garicola koreensis TaxID=1262554 RepID=A0A7W5TR46_9MICC|nr:histidine phosphatase family protein [Garicola koreensis]MBB3667630.1 putative phosphoglycerate mutase [Garicola koreensis]
MIRVILVRHGETEWNVDHRLQGQSPVDLAESGYRQARQSGRYVRAQNPVMGYVTPLERTRQTFDEFGLGFAPEVAADLIEQNLGEWEGMKTARARDEYAELYRSWKKGEGTPPGGEAPHSVLKRTTAAFCHIVRAAAEAQPTPSPDLSFAVRTVVAVSHGTSLKALMEGLGLIDRFSVISLTAAAISVIDVPLHAGPLSSSLPKGGAGISGGTEAEAQIIRSLTDEQIISYAKLRMFNLSPEVLAQLPA